MSLTFGPFHVPGIVTRVDVAPNRLQAVRRKFAGVAGESEVVCKAGGRAIAVTSVIFENYTDPRVLLNLLRLFAENNGEHGTVKIKADNGEIAETFENCTFEGFVHSDPDVPRILKDEAGKLDGGYWAIGTLQFYQLTVD